MLQVDFFRALCSFQLHVTINDKFLVYIEYAVTMSLALDCILPGGWLDLWEIGVRNLDPKWHCRCFW